MKSGFFRFLISCLLFVAFLPAADARSDAPDRGPLPVWVEIQPLPSAPEIDSADRVGGLQFLLIDRQTNIPAEQSFLHYAYRVTSSDGVQNMSDIDVTFDPSYQSLRFHMVRVHRDGRVIDNLSDHRIEVFQRESRMEQSLYDGSETAVINQKNVRIGDVIEYAYTITGFNPIHAGAYSEQLHLGFSLPIQEIHIRLIGDEGRPLNFRYFNDAAQVTSSIQGSLISYDWHITDVPAVLAEENTPLWYDPYPGAWISSYNSWSEVVDWALPHYQVDAADSESLRGVAAEIAPATQKNDRVLQTIRFVQDEVRYLGMEQGLGAYKPAQPFSVYERRFGDCKDKSLLLTALLRNLGVEAHPVLVNTGIRDRVTDAAPSPVAFNHCIVRFRYGGKQRFVDPTSSNQGGDLDHMTEFLYGRGLVIKEGVDDLDKMPAFPASAIDITYEFVVEEIGGFADLDITSVYSGLAANIQRAQLLNMSSEDLGRGNLEYYSRAFQGIRTARPVTFHDDSRDGENILVVEEWYRVDEFWTAPESDESAYFAELVPMEIAGLLDAPSGADRVSPYFLGPPIDVTLTMDLTLPEDWPVKEDKVGIKGDAYAYSSEVKGKGNNVLLKFRYQRFEEFLVPEDVRDFIDDHDRIWDDITFYVTYDPYLDDYQFSWFAASIVMVTILLGLLAAHRIHTAYDPVVGDGTWTPIPLGGPLVLLIIGMIVWTVRTGYDVVSTYLNHGTWLTVIELGGFTSFSILGATIAFEVVNLTLLVVFSCFALYQLFRKRSSFPGLMVGLLVYTTLYTIADILGVRFLIDDPAFQGDWSEDIGTIAGNVIALAVWTPYLLKARRPRHTFVNVRNPEVAEPVISPIVPDVLAQDAALHDAPSAPIDPNGIRFVRWPTSIVLAAIAQVLALIALAISIVIGVASNPDRGSIPAVVAWASVIVAFIVMAVPFLIGVSSILNRHSWSRVYNAVWLLLSGLGLVIGLGVWAAITTDPETLDAFYGSLVMSAPPIVLALVLFFSRAAREFPSGYLTYRSSIPRSPFLDDTGSPGSPVTRVTRPLQIIHLFQQIAADFPELETTVNNDDTSSPAVLAIPEQPGISRRILAYLQDDHVLFLCIGPVWLTWNHCENLIVREEFFLTVTGLLSGQYRYIEYCRGNEVIKARIERPRGGRWVLAHRWSRERWASTRRLKMETVVFGRTAARCSMLD